MFVSISEKNFQNEVIDASTPVIVNFWAPWCGLCHMVEPLLDQVQANSAQGLKLVRVNADENFSLASGYNLKSIPAVLVFNHGKLVHRLDCAGDRSYMLKELQAFLNQIDDELGEPS